VKPKQKRYLALAGAIVALYSDATQPLVPYDQESKVGDCIPCI
jgi:hypothetical protein